MIFIMLISCSNRIDDKYDKNIASPIDSFKVIEIDSFGLNGTWCISSINTGGDIPRYLKDIPALSLLINDTAISIVNNQDTILLNEKCTMKNITSMDYIEICISEGKKLLFPSNCMVIREITKDSLECFFLIDAEMYYFHRCNQR